MQLYLVALLVKRRDQVKETDLYDVLKAQLLGKFATYLYGDTYLKGDSLKR
jgi:arginine decarboxylase-like protein